MKRWGALNDMQEVGEKRQGYLDRQSPDNLSQQMSKISAAGNIIKGVGKMVAAPVAGIGTFGSGALDVASALGESKMADFLRERNSTDGLIKRAFDSARQDYVPTKVIPKTVDELASQGYNQAMGNKTKGLL